MEYEKAYNDLIARINEVKEKPSLCMKEKHHYNGYVETGIRDALDYIINPESEDERIRRGLLRCLSDIADKLFALNGISKNDALAYLERQKEVDYLGAKISFPAAYSVVSDAGYVIVPKKEYEAHLDEIRQYAYNKGIVDAEEKQKE